MSGDVIFAAGFRPQFSGHETFPLRYGWLKKVHDQISSFESKENNKGIFLNDDAIARFGVGKNMVGSMRHWALAANVIEDKSGNANKGPYALTEFGEKLFSERGLDPYLERPASVWWLHWQFASNARRMTTTYFVFNHFHASAFYRPQLLQALETYCDRIQYTNEVAKHTLKRDVDCFLRTYVSRASSTEEDSLDSQMAELALLQPIAKQDGFVLARGNKPTLPNEIFLYGLVSFALRYTKRNTFTVESITHEPGSPGRIFVMDEDSILSRLANIDEISGGRILWSETAGIRQIFIKQPYSATELINILESAYPARRRRAAAA